MGLQKQYLKYGQTARDRLFGISRGGSMQNNENITPISMLISQGVKFSNNKTAVIILGIVTLILGILLSSIPWLDYFILKNLRLWNNTLSFHYWQRPGVVRLTKVYIFNVTNPDGFLNGQKPKLEEVGPFVYREDMEKVNVQFYDNYTVSYQHNKILKFVPELSVDKSLRVVTPNIPLLTLSSQSRDLGYFISKTISMALTAADYEPFVSVTADELVFGYDDTLVKLAHTFYPKERRPLEKMGLLNGRNGTLSEVSTINTGHSGMDKFGYLNRLNGMDHLPFWQDAPCTNINASEGSFFPPRVYTNSDTVYVYDKDLCRVIPLQYQRSMAKDGIDVDYYELPENAYGDSENNPLNECFDDFYYAPAKGLQNISPCQFGAPVYISNPHFYQSDPKLLAEVEGLSPNKDLHKTYFKIQPSLGVPLEGKVRVQLNLKVDHTDDIYVTKRFRDFIFPIMWLEEGVSEVTPPIRRWIYLATVFSPIAIPIMSYSMIMIGALTIVIIFIRAYRNIVFPVDPATELLEMGRKSLRRGSTILVHHQQRVHIRRDSYALLRADENSQNIIEGDFSTGDMPYF